MALARWAAWPLALIVPIVALPGCTLLSTGFAVAPPGVNRTSFRECLLDSGFYTPTALTGIARDDWFYRHAADKPLPTKTRQQLLDQNGSAFVAGATRIIADGLMPSVQYWPSTAATAATQGLDEKGIGAPYVPIPGPGPFKNSTDNPALFERGISDPVATSKDRPDWKLNRYLDCYVGPVGAGVWAPVGGDADVEGRLLRGHILLALLTQYGTELIVSHPSRRQVAQAELLLGHIVEAERTLREASAVMDVGGRDALIGKGAITLDDPAAPTMLTYAFDDRQRSLRWSSFVTRLLRVFQVALDSERIDTQQSLDRAGNLIAAFSGGNIAGFVPIFKDALAGAASVQKTRIYGDAFLRDARESLSSHRAGTAFNQDRSGVRYDIGRTADAWQLWDEPLARACGVLATVAKHEQAETCIPDLSAKPAAPDGTGR